MEPTRVPTPIPASPAVARSQAHPLADGHLWGLLALGGVLSIAAAWMLFGFTDALDVANPDAGALRSTLSWMSLAVVLGALAVAWTGRAHTHPVLVASGLSLGLLVGLVYGSALYFTDFHDDWMFGRLFAYQVIQGLLLLPLGALAFIAGLIIWRSAPPRAPLWVAGLVAVPVALQVGFHGGIVIGIWGMLPDLVALARDLNRPREAPGPAILLVLASILYLVRSVRR